MLRDQTKVEEVIAQVLPDSWKTELERITFKYHLVAAWAAIIFDPIFAITDYFNIPESWQILFFIRVSICFITLATVLLQRRFQFPSYIIVIVPFTLISLQNAFTYRLIEDHNLLGHNLNYIALFIGAAMFLAWKWYYSVAALGISVVATAVCIHLNQKLSVNQFFVNGGLLLMTVSAFMFVLIKTRYDLTIKEIKARLALQSSNEKIQAQVEEIQAQADKIKGINDNLEAIVQDRTLDLQKKNKILEEYAFINAHKLRSPVASILGLVNIAKKLSLGPEGKEIMTHLERSAEGLDMVVSSITKTIEKGERKNKNQSDPGCSTGCESTVVRSKND